MDWLMEFFIPTRKKFISVVLVLRKCVFFTFILSSNNKHGRQEVAILKHWLVFNDKRWKCLKYVAECVLLPLTIPRPAETRRRRWHELFPFLFFFVHAISNWRTYARFEQTVKKRASVIGVEKFAAVMVAVWDKCNLFHLSGGVTCSRRFEVAN